MPGNDYKEGRVARGRSGFTLVEMLIVLVVLAILLLVAAPGFQALIRNNRMVSEVYALRAALNNARSEALSRRRDVTVCPIDASGTCDPGNDWTLGFKSYVTDPNEPYSISSRQDVGVLVRFDGANQVVFDPRGTALSSTGSFSFCDERGAEHGSGLVLNPIGSVTAAVDSDNDGVVNVHQQADGSFTNLVAADCP